MTRVSSAQWERVIAAKVKRRRWEAFVRKVGNLPSKRACKQLTGSFDPCAIWRHVSFSCSPEARACLPGVLVADASLRQRGAPSLRQP